MARYNPFRTSGPVYDAAVNWRSACLAVDTSVFQPDLSLWTPNHLDELDKLFVQNLDEGDGDFFGKLQVQLEAGSGECRRLMAEVLWVLMLFQTNIGPSKKRENVQKIWAWGGTELPEDHPMLSEPVLNGLGSAGTAYNTQRWREIAFFVTALRDFKSRPQIERTALLSDGWSFAGWLWKQEGAKNRQLPHILTHLLFPDTFERISSAGDKRAILAAFGTASEKELKRAAAADIDRHLFELRSKLEAERGKSIDFYEDEFRNDWRKSIRSWLLSWNPRVWRWETFADDRATARGGQTVTRPWSCVSKGPREGDHAYLVRTGSDPRGIIARGTVVRAPYDAPHFDVARAEAGEMKQRVDVEFSDIRDPELDPMLSFKSLQEIAPEQTWAPQSSGIEIKPDVTQALERLWNTILGEPKPHSEGQNSNPIKPRPTESVAPGEPLNLILYGPPGTGKTYRLQNYMRNYEDGLGKRYEFVTFHQNYAYEDFIEGIRPVISNGLVTYEVRPGVLRRLCERASKDPGRRYALFIDEINRGNIAKIFGELITLIEADKRWRPEVGVKRANGLLATLPYSGDPFGVPENVDIIGSMNTADRSISLLDAALRRRFYFEEMMPISGTIKGLADGLIYDDQNEEIDLRKLLDTLNARLTHLLHRDQCIGHAYFNEVKDFAGLRRVLARKVIPLLQEYFYNDWQRIRLVLGDTSADLEYQIVRQNGSRAAELFSGAEAADIADSNVFEVTAEAALSSDSIRKIYEPRG